jgi:hypothetical protein
MIQSKEYRCRATWYDTSKHKKVYRKHSTAAVSRDLIKDLNLKVGKLNNGNIVNGSSLIVTNITNRKIDIVEITDVSNGGSRHIDLSLTSFEKISKKNVGTIKVIVKKI